MSFASGMSDAMPYLPIVKAMAPKAPTGATRMIMPTIWKSTCELFSITSKMSVPRPPNLCRAKPKRTEKKSTCRISPSAKAPTTVFGMMFMMNSVVDCILPGPV